MRFKKLTADASGVNLPRQMTQYETDFMPKSHLPRKIARSGSCCEEAACTMAAPRATAAALALAHGMQPSGPAIFLPWGVPVKGRPGGGRFPGLLVHSHWRVFSCNSCGGCGTMTAAP